MRRKGKKNHTRKEFPFMKIFMKRRMKLSVRNSCKQKIQGTQSRSRLRTTIQIAMLSAISAVLMMFEFPLPFLAPPFVQIDFSEIPVIVGTFAMDLWQELSLNF